MSRFEFALPRARALMAVAVLGAGLALSGTAAAAPPATVTGSWSILIDQNYTTLDITNQGGGGGPGGSTCRVILGYLGIAPITGYYCPPTGELHFLHNNVSTGATVRTFSGSVTAATGVAPAHMAGTFKVVNVAFGPYGEYPFSASK
ncbi:hypothetical protein HNQ60_003627 [Povalibacter uvarum]|uniref:Uncharacterized protein n=1 Tax=Povalibacter uvarum TaxID=732238 RepID=A0A841HR94_9GAMM|nr:hypothetical protein [Povalibacter uvarum]MBB6094740.1 hypothetical protein [Povalibacter uvarum]